MRAAADTPLGFLGVGASSVVSLGWRYLIGDASLKYIIGRCRGDPRSQSPAGKVKSARVAHTGILTFINETPVRGSRLKSDKARSKGVTRARDLIAHPHRSCGGSHTQPQRC